MDPVFQSCDHVWINTRLAGGAAASGQCALGVRSGRIAAIKPMSEMVGTETIGGVTDVRGAWVTPGFVDCHTHLVWAGSRTHEIEMRLKGVPYGEIARQGGGILS